MRLSSSTILFLALGCTTPLAPPGDGAVAQDAWFDASMRDGSADGASRLDVGGDAAVCTRALPLLHTTLYAMVDQSGSMSDALPAGGGTKWDALTDGIHQFLLAGPAASVSFGLQYFPQTSGGVCPVSCTSNADCGACGPCQLSFCINAGTDSCDAADYAMADVSIRSASDAAGPVQTSTASHFPMGSTSTSPALAGATMYAATYAAAHADEDVTVVLVTEGDPTECDTTAANIDAIASAALPSLHTAVVSLGGVTSFTDGLAAAGGTTASVPVDLAASARAQVVMALDTVATARCTHALPTGASAATLQLQLRDGTAAQPVGHVAGRATCGSSQGFFFDDEAAPHRIELCPATCAARRTSATAAIEQIIDCAP